jgi:hypothetical protein
MDVRALCFSRLTLLQIHIFLSGAARSQHDLFISITQFLSPAAVRLANNERGLRYSTFALQIFLAAGDISIQ